MKQDSQATSILFENYVHKSTNFHRVDHFHTKTDPIIEEGLFMGSEYKFSLWKAREDTHYPPILVCDIDGYVHQGRQGYSLKVIQDETIINDYLRDIPNIKQKDLVKALNEHGFNLSQKLEEINLAHQLVVSGIFTQPIPILKDAQILRTKFNDGAWKANIHEITSWSCEKDPKLQLVNKAHLLRGLNMRLNPHGIICTNSGTGKSTFYKEIGILVDRSTKSSLSGFAKNPEEVFVSTIHRNELVYTIDQVESNYWSILDQAFNIMESGEGQCDVGGTRVNVKCNCIICTLSNPPKRNTDPTKDFSRVLNHLSSNPALGRRIGILLYDENLSRPNYASDKVLEEWKKAITFFRAVEDTARKTLLQIIKDQVIIEWIQQPIKNYGETVTQMTSSLQDNNLRGFFREHGNAGQHRVRGAALFVALTENLDLIALNEYSLPEIIRQAEEYVNEFVALNLSSIHNIVAGYDEISSHIVKGVFDSLPYYQKCIISPIELWRREKPVSSVLSLNELKNTWTNEEGEYLSKHIDTLKRHPNSLQRLNKVSQTHFGFSIYPRSPNYEIHFETLDPCYHIEPLGTLNISTISRFLQPSDRESDLIDNEFVSETRRKIENVEKSEKEASI